MSKKLFKQESLKSNSEKKVYYRMNLPANKNTNYFRRFRLLISGEKSPNESVFDNKKLLSCLKVCLYKLIFNIIPRNKLLSPYVKTGIHM